jgi:predicted site-specific integrase-resolvase
MEIFLETADVAKEVGVVPATIRQHADAGRIRVAASTKRGSRLFLRSDVENYREWRATHGRKETES